MLPLFRTLALSIGTNCQNNDPNVVCVSSLPNPTSVSDGSFVQVALQIVIAIVAAICVLFVAIGGLRYILSQGDPQGVSKAKSTIVFALIGLAITILAQGIVILAVKAIS